MASVKDVDVKEIWGGQERLGRLRDMNRKGRQVVTAMLEQYSCNDEPTPNDASPINTASATHTCIVLYTGGR